MSNFDDLFQLEAKESKLSSSMNSIKTFWSPELKKERALRKDEASKMSMWKEQYRVVQDETQVSSFFLLSPPWVPGFSLTTPVTNRFTVAFLSRFRSSRVYLARLSSQGSGLWKVMWWFVYLLACGYITKQKEYIFLIARKKGNLNKDYTFLLLNCRFIFFLHFRFSLFSLIQYSIN